jgi:hypothetical protein
MAQQGPALSSIQLATADGDRLPREICHGRPVAPKVLIDALSLGASGSCGDRTPPGQHPPSLVHDLPRPTAALATMPYVEEACGADRARTAVPLDEAPDHEVADGLIARHGVIHRDAAENILRAEDTRWSPPRYQLRSHEAPASA